MLNIKSYIVKIKNYFTIKYNNFIYFLEFLILSKKYLLEVKDLKLVFDIGFNIGNYSKTLIKKNKNIKIVAVDANQKLLNNSYNHQNLLKINCLISDKNLEKKNFYINNHFLGASTASERYIKVSRLATGSKYQSKLEKVYDEIKEVETKTIDSLIDEFGIPDLIKIDVEGYEENAIKGLTKKIPKITFEWSEEMCEDLNRTINHLQKIGFKKFGVVGYFVEKNSKVLFCKKGDPFLIEPNYFEWEEINLKSILDENRKISYGMIWAK